MIHKLKKAVGGSSKGPQRINIADALGDDEDSALQMRAEEGHGRLVSELPFKRLELQNILSCV